MATSTVTKILLRRGTDADRQSVVLSNGEPGWATDTKELYIGDGTTSGGIKIGAQEGGYIGYAGLSADVVNPYTAMSNAVYVTNNSTSNPALVITNNNTGGNGCWVNFKGNSASHAAYVANLSAIQTNSAGYTVNYSSVSTQAYYLSATNAYQMWNGYSYNYKVLGNGSIYNRGHFYSGDDNGTAIFATISGGTNSVGASMAGGATNGDYQMRTIADFNNWDPFASDALAGLSANSEVKNTQSAVMLTIEGRGAPDGASNPRGTMTVYGVLKPANNDAQNLGSGSALWDNVYSANATIQTSDKNLKDNIKTSGLGLTFINKLKPVSYKKKDREDDIIMGSKADGSDPIMGKYPRTFKREHYGLIAQDVKEVLDDLKIDPINFAGYIDPNISEGTDDLPLALRYEEFISPLIKAVQELSTEVDTLKAELAKK